MIQAALSSQQFSLHILTFECREALQEFKGLVHKHNPVDWVDSKHESVADVSVVRVVWTLRVSWCKLILFTCMTMTLFRFLYYRLESWQPWMHEYLSWQLPILHMAVITQRNLQSKTFSCQQHCCPDLMYFGWSRINQTRTMTWGEKNLYTCVFIHVFCNKMLFPTEFSVVL